MLDTVKKAIDQFYIKKDYDSFREKCKENLELFDQIKDYVDKSGKNLSSSPNKPNTPSRSWDIYLKYFKKGMFEVTYRTSLDISKVVPLFNISHAFVIENKGRDIIDLELINGGDEPYSEDQAKLQEVVIKTLKSKGYYQLTFAEMEEVVRGFKMPKDVKLYGKDVTVNLLLFIDIYNTILRTVLI